jgi:DNA-binding LacI/PurR family transcriptional regulator
MRSGRPAAVLGTSWGDLPGVDLDHLAMGHHCIGLLRRRLQGEPRVILFRPDRETIGLAKAERLMDQELEDFQVVIDRSENEFAPTAIERFKHCDVVLTANARQALGVSGWLERDLGRRVGRDVSVISLAGSPLLQFAWPSIAHYTVAGTVMERRLRRIIQRLEKGIPGGKPVTIMPDFIEGASMAQS